MNVLLIDDEPQMARLFQMTLDDLDVTVHHVTGLEEALAFSKDSRPDLVILDLALGGIDGLDILPELQSSQELEGVPVVVSSVHSSRRAEVMAAGAAGFVPRPFTTEQLMSAVRDNLASR